MSCNITTWKTKKLENLQIPVKEMFYHERKDWHPEISLDENGVATVSSMESSIVGKIIDGVLHVDEIDVSGEGSGNTFYYVLNHALSKSKGKLEAVRIWEGGEAVDRLIVFDGNVTEEEIDL